MGAENRKQKSIKKKKRRKKRYLLKFFIFLLVCVGIYFVLHIEYFTVDGITVAGNKDIPDKEILKLSELETGDNIFDVHPIMAQRRIKKNLYIEDVDVSRKLPNMVDIVVKERSGKAQFVMGKKFVVTDNDGRVLDITKEMQKVTLVEGIKVEKAKISKDIHVENTAVYNKAMDMIANMEAGDIYFKKLVIDGKKVEAYVYDGLVCKGNYDHVMAEITSGAIKAVVFDLYQKDIKKGTINIGENNYCSFTP